MIQNRTPPKRLQILHALKALLEDISTESGDAFSLRGKVILNAVLLGEDITSDTPCVSILEAPRPDFATFAGEDGQARKDNWTLLIQGITDDDRMDSSEDIFYLHQDVERRLKRLIATKNDGSARPVYKEDYLLGGKITTVEIAPPVIRPPEAKVSRFSYFYLPIRIGVAVEIGE